MRENTETNSGNQKAVLKLQVKKIKSNWYRVSRLRTIAERNTVVNFQEDWS